MPEVIDPNTILTRLPYQGLVTFWRAPSCKPRLRLPRWNAVRSVLVALAQSRLVPLKRADDVITMAGDPSGQAPVQARLGEPPPERAPVEGLRERRREPPRVPPDETVRRDPPARYEQRQAPARVVEGQDEGLLAGARRLTNRAFDVLDEMGDWVAGR